MAESQRVQKIGMQGYLQEQMGKGNELLDQAEEAARQGNPEEASRLRSEAETMMESSKFGGFHSAELNRAWGLAAVDEGLAARERMASPMAQTAGQIVKEGREILDPESATSQRFMRSLTEGGERAIAASSRGMERQARTAALGAGGARRFGAEQAIAQRGQEQLATQRAQLHTQAGAAYEQYRTDFAKDAVRFGQEFVSGSIVRDQHTQMMANLKMASAQATMQRAQSTMAYDAARQARRGASKAARTAMLSTAIGAAGTLIGAVAGGPIGAAIGGKIGGMAGGAAAGGVPAGIPGPRPGPMQTGPQTVAKYGF